MKSVCKKCLYMVIIGVGFTFSLSVDETSDLKTKRIINGMDAEPGQFPYVMSLRFSWDLDRSVCTAALITTETALSAAHCITDPRTEEMIPVEVVVGILGSVQKDDVRNKVYFQEGYRHEEFSLRSGANDIATFILTVPVKLNEFVQTIALTEGVTVVGENVIAVGWGLFHYGDEYGEKLRYMKANLTEPKICVGRFNGKEFHPGKQLCLLAQDEGTGTFQGDSGGPLVLEDLDMDVCVGVLSFGASRRKNDLPSVYTSVSSYNDWIKKNIVGTAEFVKVSI